MERDFFFFPPCKLNIGTRQALILPIQGEERRGVGQHLKAVLSTFQEPKLQASICFSSSQALGLVVFPLPFSEC